MFIIRSGTGIYVKLCVLEGFCKIICTKHAQTIQIFSETVQNLSIVAPFRKNFEFFSLSTHLFCKFWVFFDGARILIGGQLLRKTRAELGTVLKSGQEELVRGLACELSELNRSNSGGFWIFLKFI